MNLRLIAFYLTQFHPTKENDDWWGKGFTEWTNVTKSAPLFDGHYQPHLPTDFGFYDLRVRETRRDQIRTAKEYGIDGFCYHYYWFSGTRLLNAPLDDMLADPESDMPFCLCWANENWTKRWDAAEHEVLIAQKYLPDDDLKFINSLVPFLSDPRYIRLNGVPILIVYRPQHLPDARKSAHIWREYCRSEGIGEIHICAALTHGNMDFAQYGFDSGVEFPPHNTQTRNISHCIDFFDPFSGNVMQFGDIARSFLNRTYSNHNVFRGVFPSWDNTARTGNRAQIVINGTPENYEYWLAESIRKTTEDFPEHDRFVFINAWNEWAEGCHLEPDRKFQRKFLESTLRAKRGESQYSSFTHTELPAQFVGGSRTVISDLRALVNYHFSILLGRLRVWVRRRPGIAAVVSRIFALFR